MSRLYIDICIYISMNSCAQDYIRVLEKIKGEISESQKADTQSKNSNAQNWLNMAKNLWEDRDYPDLWK